MDSLNFPEEDKSLVGGMIPLYYIKLYQESIDKCLSLYDFAINPNRKSIERQRLLLNSTSIGQNERGRSSLRC